MLGTTCTCSVHTDSTTPLDKLDFLCYAGFRCRFWKSLLVLLLLRLLIQRTFACFNLHCQSDDAIYDPGSTSYRINSTQRWGRDTWGGSGWTSSCVQRSTKNERTACRINTALNFYWFRHPLAPDRVLLANE